MPVVTAAVSMEGKSAGELSQFIKDELNNSLEGIEGVASLSTTGMITDNIQVVLSQEKINDINAKVASSINSQMGRAEGQIKSGINAANDSKKQIEQGKEGIVSGYQQATAMKSQMENSKKQLQEAINAAPNDEVKEQLEKQLEVLESNIAEIDKQLQSSSFTMSTRYADLAAAESTIAATVNQLQQALSEIQSSKEAALASADMTGVLTMSNISGDFTTPRTFPCRQAM